MEKKKFKLGLVPKLIIAIIIGILFGQFLPTGFCRFVVTLSGFFSTYLKFIIPLMILAYVTMGIADLSQGAGQLLLITVALAYGSTLLAGTASYLVSSNLFPHFMTSGALDQISATADASLKPYFSLTITPLFDTLSAIVLAFILGLCLSTMKGKEIGISLATVVPFIMTLGVAMVASPGAPGGSIMTALPFLYMVFGTTAGDTNGPICALMVALYITQDSFGTACNISGDNAIGIVVDSIYKKFILKEDTVEA